MASFSLRTIRARINAAFVERVFERRQDGNEAHEFSRLESNGDSVSSNGTDSPRNYSSPPMPNTF